MSGTDTLLSAFLHVMSFCLLYFICYVHCFSFRFFSYVPCVRFLIINNTLAEYWHGKAIYCGAIEIFARICFYST